MEFKDLLVEHDYYASPSNYYSKEPKENWKTFQDFYDEYHNADIDINLIYRWDIREDEDGSLYMEVIFIRQRKGIYSPQHIEKVTESDFENIQKLLQPHMDKIAKNWLPFTPSKNYKLNNHENTI